MPLNRERCHQIKDAFAGAIRDVLSRGLGTAADLGGLYATVVAVVVANLVGEASWEEPSDTSSSAVCHETGRRIAQEIGPMSPEDVGAMYEFLRGLRLDISGGRITLVPSARGKRNEGLFYTPLPVVRHIVRRTLDALGILSPEDYLALKILDPAVGTGVFLAEALDELSARVLTPEAGKAVGDAEHALPQDPDAVRIHVLTRCLYGVDLDQVAVSIARATLLRRAVGQAHRCDGIEPNLKVGNALMGQIRLTEIFPAEEDQRHARAFFGKNLPSESDIALWAREKGLLHWHREAPEVFADRPGFDAVIGNPPYEILSVKESGIGERSRDQAYFRRTYRTCHGKINTYRLMLERGLTLLRPGGALGFIVPATLLADTTAAKTREMLLDESEILEALVIPEKARVFEGVTQALLILVTRKGVRTTVLAPTVWDGNGPIPTGGDLAIDRELIASTDLRIPVIRSGEEKALLEALMIHPRFGGDHRADPLGRVHQGEMNLTVHREFITERPTGYALVRGEHVTPFHVTHPSARPGRLDWVQPQFLDREAASPARSEEHVNQNPPTLRSNGNPWESERIVLGRVVNMATRQRLKAALVPAGVFLGDMTNFIAKPKVPSAYLVGVLNSRLLNWRMKLTSTNNYLSAAEIEALPVPRVDFTQQSAAIVAAAQAEAVSRFGEASASLPKTVEILRAALGNLPSETLRRVYARTVTWTAELLMNEAERQGRSDQGRFALLRSVLDAAVLLLYGVEEYADLLDRQ